MKICHIIFSLNIGGAESMLVDIVNEQNNHAKIMIIIINDSYNIDLIKHLGNDINVILLNRKPSSKNILPIIRLNKALLEFNPDFIHAHNENIVNIILPVFRKKLFVTIHGLHYPTQNLPKYKGVFAISNGVAKDVEDRENIHPIVIYNGIRIKNVKQKCSNTKNEYFKIVQIGSLQHNNKGQHLLIEAIKVLKEKNKLLNITVDFIGDGPSRHYLQNLVTEYKLNNEIKLLGLISRDYIHSNLCNYDLLVQPSINEGFGLTIVEAIAAKVPVLISNIDGPMEIINNGAFGFYFEKGNVEDLAQKIENIMMINEEVLSKETSNAYNYVANKFDVKITANNYMYNYKIC